MNNREATCSVGRVAQGEAAGLPVVLRNSLTEQDVRNRVHPSQKPIELMMDCLQMVPDARVVLDPFMGSGSAGVAAVQLGRSFLGIEIHEPYFQVACERIENAQRQERLFA
jgi:site-specific DNA-methyltransferase (adenine-specific)